LRGARRTPGGPRPYRPGHDLLLRARSSSRSFRGGDKRVNPDPSWEPASPANWDRRVEAPAAVQSDNPASDGRPQLGAGNFLRDFGTNRGRGRRVTPIRGPPACRNAAATAGAPPNGLTDAPLTGTWTGKDLTPSRPGQILSSPIGAVRRESGEVGLPSERRVKRSRISVRRADLPLVQPRSVRPGSNCFTSNSERSLRTGIRKRLGTRFLFSQGRELHDRPPERYQCSPPSD
jgi:hypothetical protein